MTPTTKNQLPNEAELLEIEQDLDTEDFLIEDLYELSGTEDSEWLESAGMGTDEITTSLSVYVTIFKVAHRGFTYYPLLTIISM